ncbi:MAG: hypothetical protein MI922_13190 [Bacteroidales bacterium]|nr:hypothetical protein [Bacteroidales bacterium]
MKNILSIAIILSISCLISISCKKDIEKEIKEVDKDKTVEVPTNPFKDPLKKVTPANQANNVSTMLYPSVQLKYAISEVVEHEGKRYMFKLKNWKVMEGEELITGNKVFFNDNTGFTFISDEEFKPSTQYSISFYTSVLYQDTLDWVQIDSIPYNSTFTTGSQETSGILTDEDIEFMYPQPRQYNFLTDEYDRTYISFKNMYSWMLGEDVSLILAVTGNNLKRRILPLYDENGVYYADGFNSIGLDTNSIYKLEYSYVTGDDTISFYNVHFKTSMYSTFKKKMEHFQFTKHTDHAYFDGVYRLGASAGYSELFDYYDLKGEKYWNIDGDDATLNNGFIQVENIMENKWYDTIKSTIYASIEKNPGAMEWRTAKDAYSSLSKAVYIKQVADEYVKLSDEEIQTGTPLGYTNMGIYNFTIRFTAGYIAYKDYLDVRTYLTDMGKDSPRYTNVLSGWSVQGKHYHFQSNVKYVLPGINKTSSTVKLTVYGEE